MLKILYQHNFVSTVGAIKILFTPVLQQVGPVK
jgi:hypothetical protein